MDGRTFDELASGLAFGATSRRRVLRLLAGGVLGVVLGRRGDAEAADCRRVGLSCRTNRDCCLGSTCERNRCRCRSGLRNCGGRCRDLFSDPRHCGRCGRACQPGQTCDRGLCVGCPRGTADCGEGGICRDLRTDPNHCGGCWVGCFPGQTCVRGVCVGCPTGSTDCGGWCRDLQTDPNNCGACGNVCPAGHSCVGGRCACPTCGGVCVDLQTDPLNCGSCGNSCTSFGHCCRGVCRSIFEPCS